VLEVQVIEQSRKMCTLKLLKGLFCGITRHRHVPEIEHGFCDASKSKVIVSFTLHLMPISREMKSAIYAETASAVNKEDLSQHV